MNQRKTLLVVGIMAACTGLLIYTPPGVILISITTGLIIGMTPALPAYAHLLVFAAVILFLAGIMSATIFYLMLQAVRHPTS